MSDVEEGRTALVDGLNPGFGCRGAGYIGHTGFLSINGTTPSSPTATLTVPYFPCSAEESCTPSLIYIFTAWRV